MLPDYPSVLVRNDRTEGWMGHPEISKLLADQRVRFVVVGGINTVVGYGLFVIFELFFGKYVGYLGSLYASYAIATMLAFALHRRYTFGITGSKSLVLDFLRFASVYVVTLLINTVLLPLLVEIAALSPIAAQALIVVFTTLVSYFGHKWFSFRRASRPNPTDEPFPSSTLAGHSPS